MRRPFTPLFNGLIRATLLGGLPASAVSRSELSQ